MVSVLARYAARFSVRANDVTVDASLLWVGAVLAVAAAVAIRFGGVIGFSVMCWCERLSASTVKRCVSFMMCCFGV